MTLDYLIIGIIAITLILILVLVRNIRRKSKQYKAEKELLEEKLDTAVNANDTKNIVNSNINLIEKYYDQNLLQHRLTFTTTLIISGLGVVTILIGVLIYFRYPEKESIGTLTTISGIVIELISSLFFYQNKKIMDLLKSNHKSLENGLYLQNAISLTEELSKADKNTELKKIIKFLLSQVTNQEKDNSA